jgi:hypothetical protein
MNDIDKLRSEYIEKARQSQIAMWTAIGSVLGFIVSAASVVAAVKKDVSPWALFPLLILSFCGISAVLGCFLAQKKEYVRILTDLMTPQQLSPTEQVQKALRDLAGPNHVMRLERISLWLLALTILLFLVFCWISF